jgi:hypothetical protein
MINSPKRTHQSMQNTLNLLTEKELTIFHNQPIVQEFNGNKRISWPNHASARHNCGEYFNKIAQYRGIIQANAYTCLLFDGALIRASYCFQINKLVSHSLLWWPSPFPLDKDDLGLGSVLDVFDLYADNGWQQSIFMRSPIRFDFDVNNLSEAHPISHMHIQSDGCRLPVDRPVCFNRFIKFVFKNFYPQVYPRYSFWEDLEDAVFLIEEPEFLTLNQSYIGWHDKGRNF